MKDYYETGSQSFEVSPFTEALMDAICTPKVKVKAEDWTAIVGSAGKENEHGTAKPDACDEDSAH